MTDRHPHEIYRARAHAARSEAITALTRGAGAAIAAGFSRMGDVVRAARARRRAIRALGALDDHILTDIGVPRDRIEDAVAGLLRQEAPTPRPARRTRVHRVGGRRPDAAPALRADTVLAA